MKTGFDNRKYLAEQTAAIHERVAEFGTRLYLELGGRLVYDYHAPRRRPALERLEGLRGCEVHSTHIPTPGDEEGLRKLGVNLTSDPQFSSHSLFAA